MTSLRLLADDLTGALDTAAEFVPLTGPVPVFWSGAMPPVLPPSAALDSATREQPGAAAAAIAAALAPHLAGAGIAYKKIDSLLRGPALAEVVACLRAGPWRSCVLAPAFPFQGRITTGGVQRMRDATSEWTAVCDLLAELQSLGVAAQPGRLDADLPAGLSVFDAETDADLARVARFVQAQRHPLLLAGTGGLAQAMAATARPVPAPSLPLPILGLFGSDHAVTALQLAACGAHHLRLAPDASDVPNRIGAALEASGVALVSLALPDGLSRSIAAERIHAAFHHLTGALRVPGTLVASGGETLRGLCVSLGAERLDVIGRLQPGVPVSLLRGGRWDGVTVVSKSGAFGVPTLLRDHLPLQERTA
jgi:uncharacterized protein YgbK (DUF1537 family)